MARQWGAVALSILVGCGLSQEKNLLEDKEYVAASTSLEKKLRDDPSCGECAYLLGVARISEGSDTSGALVALTTARREWKDGAARVTTLLARLMRQLGDDKEAAKLELGAMAQAVQWTPVLARTPGDPRTLLATETVAADCKNQPGCHQLKRGDVVDVDYIENDVYRYSRRVRVEKKGWMYDRAFQRRRWWRGKPFKSLLFGRARDRVPDEGEPWVFKKRPPECPRVGMAIAGYWIWMMRQHPNEFIAADVRRDVRETGRILETRRPGWGGTCTGQTVTMRWKEVQYKTWETIFPGVTLARVARGTGDSEIDRRRGALITSTWPEQLRGHLLKGELAKGLPFGMTKAAVGVDLKREDVAFDGKLIEIFRGEAAAIKLVFHDGVLTSWERDLKALKPHVAVRKNTATPEPEPEPAASQPAPPVDAASPASAPVAPVPALDSLKDLALMSNDAALKAARALVSGGTPAESVTKVLNTRGMRLYRKKRFKEAAVAFELGHTLHPTYELAPWNRACVAGLLGDAPGAVAWLRKLKALNTPTSRKYLGWMKTDNDFNPIRSHPTFKAFYDSHFK